MERTTEASNTKIQGRSDRPRSTRILVRKVRKEPTKLLVSKDIREGTIGRQGATSVPSKT